MSRESFEMAYQTGSRYIILYTAFITIWMSLLFYRIGEMIAYNRFYQSLQNPLILRKSRTDHPLDGRFVMDVQNQHIVSDTIILTLLTLFVIAFPFLTYKLFKILSIIDKELKHTTYPQKS